MKDPRVHLAQILESLDRIHKFTVEGHDAFFRDERTQFAVVRCFEIIGEAAKRIPRDYREQHPLIPWRNMTAFRDVLIHDYDRVDLQRVWQVIAEDAPQLRLEIARLLPPLESLEAELSGESPLPPKDV